MRFLFIIILLWIVPVYPFNITSNYPLPKNNIYEVYKNLKNKKDIIKFLEKTDSFININYAKDKLHLIRKPIIKKIYIYGNDSFWDREIKGISGIYEGKYISNKEFSLIPLKIKQFYFDTGFLDADISIKLKINKKGYSKVFVNINEGNRYKIKDVKFISDIKLSPNTIKEYKQTLNLKNKKFNFSNIQKKMENLLKKIKNKGYYDAFMSIFSLHKINKEELLIYINVIHGFKYKIRFVGNYSIKDNVLIKFSNFAENSVNYYYIQQFAKKIQQFYKSQGFLDANVDYSYNEFLEKKASVINIYIFEGKRYKISEIYISSDHKVPDKINNKLKSLKNNYYQEKLLKDILEKYINDLRNKGFKNAYYIISYKENNNNLILKIQLHKGKRFIIKNIYFKGYKTKISIKTPLIYEGEILTNLLERLKQQLKENGYLDGEVYFKIDLKEKYNNILVFATYYIKTGSLYKTNEPFIYGTWHLNPKVIKWNVKKSKPYKKEDSNNELNFLYTSYIFSFINPDIFVEKSEKKVYKIFVLGEDKRGLFQGTIGYNSIEKFKASLSVIFKNLFDYGLEVNGYVDVSTLNTNYNISFGNRLLPKYSSLFLSVYSSLQNHKYYDIVKKGIKIDYAKRPNKWATQFLTISYDKNNLKNTNIPFKKNPYEKYNLYLGLNYDNRNNKIFPTDGFYFRTNIGKTFSDVEYFFGNISFRYYYKIFFLVLTQNIATGGNFISIEKLPISERYFLGGFSTMRGFGYEEISNNGKGGNSYAYINTDIRYPIVPAFNLYGFLFYDVGNVFENKKEYKKFNVRKTVGLGVLVPTPAGAFMFDYAQILDRKLGEKNFRIEFSINVVF